MLLRTNSRAAASRHRLGTTHLQWVHHVLTEILKSGVQLVRGDVLDVL